MKPQKADEKMQREKTDILQNVQGNDWKIRCS